MDTPNSLNQPDQPADAVAPDARNGYSAPVARLAALAMHLGTRGLNVDVTREGLFARDPNRPDTAHSITCRPRPEDADRLWFFARTEEVPIAEAEQIFEAALAICALLTAGDKGDHR